MAFPRGNESADSSDDAKINALLGGGDTATATADVDDRAAEDTSVADADMPTEGEETEVDESEAEGATEEEGATGEEEAGETDFALTEDDSDFSADAYARAAEHLNKARKRPLDLNDPDDHDTVREWMSRGKKIAELQASRSEENVEEEEAAPAKTEEAPPAAPAKLTTEQIMQRMAEARQYAKSTLVPEVAKEFSTGIVNALWPGKGVGEKMTQEQHNALTETFSTFGAMLIADAMPSIFQAVPQAVINGDPMMGRVRDMAMREAALDELFEARDKVSGGELYPGLEKMLDSGEIKRQLNGAELKDAVFSKDPYKNLVAKIKVAYKFARGKPVDTKALTKAAERGRAQERERNVRVGAGKLPPGSSRGSFAAPGTANNFINRLVAGGGSKFHRAIMESQKK